jgi:hypothetical protein
MPKKSQDQHIGDNSKGLQGGRDAIDNSITNNYGSEAQQEKKDFGIIEEIFEFLFSKDLDNLNFTETSNGKGLKKIPLNFSGDSLLTINEIVLQTTKKRNLVKQFVNNQREINESKIDALILKFQKDFRSLKNTKSHYEKVVNVKIIEKMAENCIDDASKDNPDYCMNAIAIVLYFFEMCDFGKSTDERVMQKSIF